MKIRKLLLLATGSTVALVGTTVTLVACGQPSTKETTIVEYDESGMLNRIDTLLAQIDAVYSRIDNLQNSTTTQLNEKDRLIKALQSEVKKLKAEVARLIILTEPSAD